MQLTAYHQLTAQLELTSGLLIGSGNDAMKIGGADKTVMRNPLTQQPYIPGSSIKGKLRSLLEWRAGLVGITQGKPVGLTHLEQLSGEQKQQAQALIQLFGTSPDPKHYELAEQLGPTRISCWDADLNAEWLDNLQFGGLTEVKAENSINRITGTADNPRFFERVPAGARFDLKITWKELQKADQQLQSFLLAGLKLLEMEGLGSSLSRGYGKVQLVALQIDGEDLKGVFDQLDPFASKASAST